MEEFEKEMTGSNEPEQTDAQPVWERQAEESAVAEEFPTEEIPVSEENPSAPSAEEQPSVDGQTDGFEGPVFPSYPVSDQPQNGNFAPSEPIRYTPVVSEKDFRPASRGLKAFCICMAAVIVLSSVCLVGYFLGKSGYGVGEYKKNVTLDLTAKPKDTDENTAAQVYDAVTHSVVGILVYNTAGDAASASGVIYSEDGYIITNDHIYSEVGAPKFKVYLHDGTEYDANYVAGDSISDLAVLKLKKASGLTPATFGNSDELVCGESVVAIGRPSEATDDSSVTKGIISLTKRRVKTTSNYTARLIQTDSAINPGSSGGALVNMYNQVVGITSAKLAGVYYDSIGFAIPTTTVKRVVTQLISDGKVTDRAKLGITYTEVTSVAAELNNYSSTGLYVASVGEDSDLYGKLKEGDIITHVNGKEITNDDIMLDVIEESRAGDKLHLTVVQKNGGTAEYDVTLRANVGESSYSDKIIESDKGANGGGNSGGNGGTFDFPFGE